MKMESSIELSSSGESDNSSTITWIKCCFSNIYQTVMEVVVVVVEVVRQSLKLNNKKINKKMGGLPSFVVVV